MLKFSTAVAITCIAAAQSTRTPPHAQPDIISERLIARPGRIATLSRPPIAGSVRVYLNGLRITEPGDYTLSGQQVTFAVHYSETGLIQDDVIIA